MLHPNFKEIIKAARKNDLAISILSNLTLCNSEIVKLLKENDVAVQVSLYSTSEHVHDTITRLGGSFRKTMDAIEMLHEADVPCFISCPLMKQNATDYLKVLAFARSLKMDAMTDFVIMGKKNGDTSNLKCRLDLSQIRKVINDVVYKSLPTNNEYFSASKKERLLSEEEWSQCRVCGAGTSLLCLDAHGDYHPCPGLGGVVLGNCFKNSLKWVLLESPETKRIRAVMGRDFRKCVNCEDRDYCNVCMCKNYNESGDLFAPATYFCEVAKINHEVVDSYHRKLAAV